MQVDNLCVRACIVLCLSWNLLLPLVGGETQILVLGGETTKVCLTYCLTYAVELAVESGHTALILFTVLNDMDML